ncbi:MAG: hypothetical protein ABGY71_06730 [bacterium]|jgi:DNA repair exonuclease SbcCD ATPase subunit|nr:hypothetical protein [Planctomycetota bacterium]HIL51966.1 hypothetical protein [Planctomycetota bacterium]
MSPIGRIFIVLNLILAALFLSWAANNLATSHQYKQQLEDAQAAAAIEKAALDSELSELQAQLDNKTSDADRFRAERDSAVDAERRASQENASLQGSNAGLAATNDKNASTISDFESHITSLESAKDQAVSAQHGAEGERDDALSSAEDATTKAGDLEAQNAALGNQISDMQSEIVALNGRISELDTHLATVIDVTGANIDDILAQKLINGSVLQANYDIQPGLVAINVGKDSGVTRGYTFQIFNGSEYKGEVRVENVRDKMCTALILTTVNGQSIQQGDRATTRL